MHQFEKAGRNQVVYQVVFINVAEELPRLMIAFKGRKQRTELLNLSHL